jgi:hypothetical protein
MSFSPESIEYADWFTHRVFILVPAQAEVARWLESFKDFPPRAKTSQLYRQQCDGKNWSGHR